MTGNVNTRGANATELAALKSTAETADTNATTALSTIKNLSNTVAEMQTTLESLQDSLTKLTNTIDIVPSQSGTLTYTGEEQSPTWNNYDSTTLTIGGTTSATEVGSYTATFTPNDGYTWGDGTQSTIEVTWTIGNAVISTVPSQSGTLTYTGSAQSPTWANYDSTKMTIGGTTSATDAGSYTATFTPAANYEWSDGSTTAKNVTWKITGVAITTTPSQSGSLTYTGSALTPTWSDYDSTQLTIGGTTSATNAGSYTATFTPTGNYTWSDGTTSAKSVTWTIGKATGSMSLSSTSETLIGTAGATSTVTVTRSGDGTVSATSSDTSIATVSVSGTTVTITSVATGTATITVSVAAGTNYTAPSSQTIAVTVTLASSTLNNNSPDVIQAVAQAGQASNFWSVGDRIGIALSGTVGALSLSGTYYAYILGFDHNSTYEGSNTIHFQFGFTALSSGVHIAFIDGGYADYYSDSSSARFVMNSSETNSGGWASCRMRSTICPAFLAAMPSAWQSAISACTKYSDNTGGGSNTASYVTSTSDSIWLLSEYEVQGARSYANSAEQNYQKQYTYYANGNSKVMYRHSSTSSTCGWWLRSVNAATSNRFCGVDASGSASYNGADSSDGFAPGFKVA